jgi:hypothetical protein
MLVYRRLLIESKYEETHSSPSCWVAPTRLSSCAASKSCAKRTCAPWRSGGPIEVVVPWDFTHVGIHENTEKHVFFYPLNYGYNIVIISIFFHDFPLK